MTIREKRAKIINYCSNNFCGNCILSHTNGSDWCATNSFNTDDEEALDEALKLIGVAQEEQNESTEPKEDLVNHPSHYTHGMECIDEMILIFGKEAVKNFCICNAWKYRKRALHKNGQQDMDKSDWYINKYKELCELCEVS